MTENYTMVHVQCSIFTWICQHPTAAFGATFVVQLLPFIITGLLLLAGSDVFPADFTDIPLELSHDHSFKRVTAWNRRDQDPDEPIFRPKFHLVGDEPNSNIRHIVADVIELYYSTKYGENILTVENIKAINNIHFKLFTDVPFLQDFCVTLTTPERPQSNNLDPGTNCAPVQSLMHYIFSPKHQNHLINDDLLEARLNLFKTNSTLRRKISEFLPKKVDYDKEIMFSDKMRAYLTVAWAKYNETGKPASTQKFAAQFLGPYLWKISQDGLDNLDISFYNPYLYFDRLQYQVKSDLMLATGSFCFIFCFLWLQTSSLFITVFGIFSIGSNFFTANLIYRYIFDFHYFGVFNVLSVFIILGIGVDDIFIFHDAWLGSASESVKGVEGRLAFSYRRSCFSMFTTSLTTIAAFTVNSFSPLLAISSFGLFSATLVLANYISVISFFPCLLIFNHTKVLPTFEHPVFKYFKLERLHAPIWTWKTFDGKVIDWFCKKYAKIVVKPSVQAFILMVMATLFGFLAYSATQLTSDNQPIRLYVKGHPLGKSMQQRKELYNPPLYNGDLEFIRLFFIWGISDLDKTQCHKTDWKNCPGKILWDHNFDLNPYHAQRDLLKFCKNLRNMNDNMMEELRVQKSNGLPDVDCFIESMDSYFESEFRQIIYTSREITGLPATDMKIEALMMNYPQLYDLSSVLRNKFFYRNFETASLFWLYDGYRFLSEVQRNLPQDSVRRVPINLTAETIQTLSASINRSINPSPAHLKFGEYVGNSLNSTDIERRLYKNLTLTYGTKLRYAAVVVNTTMTYLIGHSMGLKIFNQWENYFANAKKSMAPSLQGGFIATPDRNEISTGLYHWLKVQEELSASAIRGIIISLAIALPVLILSTDDVIIGTLATGVICCAAASVIGVIPLLGWKLGVLESLNLTLVVGLAIDYIVHVAEAYHLSMAVGRKNKVVDVLDKVGGSIISGAISTLGSSLFMLFAQIAFFSQFGLFIFLTVGFSLIYSLGMFIVLLGLIGPETRKYSLQNIAFKLIGSLLQENDDGTSGQNALDTVSQCTNDDHVIQKSIGIGEKDTQHEAVRHPYQISENINQENVCSANEQTASARPQTAWKIKKKDGQNPSNILPPLSKL